MPFSRQIPGEGATAANATAAGTECYSPRIPMARDDNLSVAVASLVRLNRSRWRAPMSKGAGKRIGAWLLWLVMRGNDKDESEGPTRKG